MANSDLASHSHDAEADFAASELARIFAVSPQLCYSPVPTASISASATYEPSSTPWPKADGLVLLLESGPRQDQRHVAVEYKRSGEGIHGLLTGLGQAYAYLHKGYSGTALVVPRRYPTLAQPAEYLAAVLDGNPGSSAIGVFAYDEPDTGSPKPFEGRLHCIRALNVTTSESRLPVSVAGPKTQWVHMREGSTTRDAFFRFLQVAKRLTAGGTETQPPLSQELVDAVNRAAPESDPAKYLSSTVDDRLLSRIWRDFWFDWVATPAVLTPWKRFGGQYATPNAFTRIQKDDGTGLSQLLEGRSSSLKNVVADLLNEGSLSEQDAWDAFVRGLPKSGGGATQGLSQRAHSYREDLDSALVHLELIEPDGQPTDIGYHYAAICERYGGANSQAAKDFIGAALVQNGRYGSFLHYIYRLSEERFSADPLAYTRLRHGRPIFDESSYSQYLQYLEDQLSNELKVLRKVGTRKRPRLRTPFQVELTLLRNYGFVGAERHRLGVGIPIDWIKVQEAMARDL